MPRLFANFSIALVVLTSCTRADVEPTLTSGGQQLVVTALLPVDASMKAVNQTSNSWKRPLPGMNQCKYALITDLIPAGSYDMHMEVTADGTQVTIQPGTEVQADEGKVLVIP